VAIGAPGPVKEVDRRATGHDGTGHDGTANRVAAWLRPAWVEVDLDAVKQNVAYIHRAVAPATVCAVVKADGYGHGAVPVAWAALAGGATHLAVALAEEGHELRRAGIEVPVLVLSEPPPAAMPMVVSDGLAPTVYTYDGLAALVAAVRDRSSRPRDQASRPLDRPPPPVPLHLKLDTGMHRVGADRATLMGLARAVTAEPGVNLEGLFTHLAVADEPDRPFTAKQAAELDGVARALAAEGIRPPLIHAANSAGALFHPRARYAMVRAGIAIYGLAPAASLRAEAQVKPLRPALALKAQVSYAQELPAGERLSYGLHYRLLERSVVATVPLGYADGVPRRLFQVGGEVLIGGRRLPVAGAVTMDQILVDCGPGASVRAGDEVVLLGRQGDEEVTAWEWAERLGTIAYEVTCALSPRLPRTYRASQTR
jgi:alanine racemase